MSETFNFRNPNIGEVQDLQYKAKALKYQKEKYKVLSALLKGDGKAVDITASPELFEAINREKLDFETIMRMHPRQVKETMEDVKRDSGNFTDGKYWNRKSPAKWGLKGHIPTCVYYARPVWYWKDQKLVNNFFNMFPKFRISSKPL